jgi:capsular polysaccharide biosynthesis protein
MIIDKQEQNVAVEGVEDQYVLSLRNILRALRRWFWVVVLIVILFLGMATGFSLMQTPEYKASARILVGEDRGIVQNPANAVALQQLGQTVVEAAKSRSIAEDVIERLGLGVSPEELNDKLEVQQISNTQFISISYQDPDAPKAQEIANAVGEALSTRISEIDADAVTATIWEQASLPNKPVKPNLKLNILVALVSGMSVGVGLAFLLEYLDDSWRSPGKAKKRKSEGVPLP